MTNLLTVLPEFDIKPFTHILPSLERALVSTADLLTLHALDVAKRAQVPLGEVKKLADALLEGLHADVVGSDGHQRNGVAHIVSDEDLSDSLANRKDVISTLDDELDRSLGGGIASGYLTEVVGERYV